MVKGTPDYMIVTGGRTPERFITYSQVQVPTLCFEDFEGSVIKWRTTDIATLSFDSTDAAGEQASGVYNGSKCLKILPDAGREASIYRIFPLLELVENVGVSFYFMYEDQEAVINASDGFILIDLEIWTGSKYLRFIVSYNTTAGKWYYSDDNTSTYTEFLKRTAVSKENHYIKLFIDLTNSKAKFCIVDGDRKVFDDISLYSEDDLSTAPGIKITSNARSKADYQATWYMDDFKITYNEPA